MSSKQFCRIAPSLQVPFISALRFQGLPAKVRLTPKSYPKQTQTLEGSWIPRGRCGFYMLFIFYQTVFDYHYYSDVRPQCPLTFFQHTILQPIGSSLYRSISVFHVDALLICSMPVQSKGWNTHTHIYIHKQMNKYNYI